MVFTIRPIYSSIKIEILLACGIANLAIGWEYGKKEQSNLEKTDQPPEKNHHSDFHRRVLDNFLLVHPDSSSGFEVEDFD